MGFTGQGYDPTRFGGSPVLPEGSGPQGSRAAQPGITFDDQGRPYKNGRPYREFNPQTGEGSGMDTFTTIENGQTVVHPSTGLSGDMVSALRDEDSADSNAFNWQGQRDGAAKDVAWNKGWENIVANRAAPKVDLTADTQSRGLQMAGLNGYQGMLNGTGPSLADSRLNQGLARASGAMGAAQAGASRSNMASAGRAGLQQLAQGAQTAIQAGVDQRTNEMNLASRGLANGSIDMYVRDLKSAMGRAGLELDNREANDKAAGGFAQNAITVQGNQMKGGMDKQLTKQRAQGVFNEGAQAGYASQKATNDRAVGLGLGIGSTVLSLGTNMSGLAKGMQTGKGG